MYTFWYGGYGDNNMKKYEESWDSTKLARAMVYGLVATSTLTMGKHLHTGSTHRSHKSAQMEYWNQVYGISIPPHYEKA